MTELKELLERFSQIAKQYLPFGSFEDSFTLYNNSSSKFATYLFTGNDQFPADDRIELVFMDEKSIPHYHTQDGYFIFPSTVNRAKLHLGRWEEVEGKKIATLRTFCPRPQLCIRIGKNIVHAAGPLIRGEKIPLFICNEVGRRDRDESGYPIDTYFVDEVLYKARRPMS